MLRIGNRFIDYGGMDKHDVILRIRDFPEAATAEDTLRELLPDGQDSIDHVLNSSDICFKALLRTLDEQGPFDGILGYSEGAVIASTLILEEKRRFEEEGVPRSIKCAVFFCGWPPMRINSGKPYLVDEDGEVIDVPTVHVVGSQDPYIDGKFSKESSRSIVNHCSGSMALYNVCDQDEARFFDHGKGHTLPRDPQTLVSIPCALISVTV